jgi:hypothetical protein
VRAELLFTVHHKVNLELVTVLRNTDEFPLPLSARGATRSFGGFQPPVTVTGGGFLQI